MMNWPYDFPSKHSRIEEYGEQIAHRAHSLCAADTGA